MKITDQHEFVRALLKRDFPAAERLLSLGGDINGTDETGWSPLHYVAEHGLVDSAHWLFERGADPNVRGAGGWTPLLQAIDSESDSAKEKYVLTGNNASDCSMVCFLLEHGADPNSAADDGTTPEALAKAYGSTEVLQALERVGRRPRR